MGRANSKKQTKALFQEIGDLFRLPGDVKSVEEINNGKVNKTYKVSYNTNRIYLFQNFRVNAGTSAENVMENIDAVSSYLRSHGVPSLHFRHNNSKQNYVSDTDGSFWRVRRFVDSSEVKSVADMESIRNIGLIMGELQNALKDFDVSQLHVNFPELHKTREIISRLNELDYSSPEKEFLLNNIDKASFIYDDYLKGNIKQSVVHNDFRIKNLLFDKNSGRPNILINIDMVQPGIALYDMASTAIYLCHELTLDNDNKFVETSFNLTKFEAFLEGYLKAAKFSFSELEMSYIGRALFAISCEAASINIFKFVTNNEVERESKAKFYVALAKDIKNKKLEIEELISKVLNSITDEYVRDINQIDRDVTIDKQTDYKPGEYMNIIMPHNVKVRGGKCYAFFKRAFDVFASLMALIILSPVMLIVGILVKLTSKGPMIYVSKRVGQNGRIFKFYKFRSMYKDAESRLEELLSQNEIEGGVTFKMKNDPRITPFGRFIRKTSLDELPQLVNILKGDMSIIGPRVGLPREVEMYPREALDRLLVPQGLSGEWQANGRSNTTFDVMIKMDMDYIENKRGFWHDIGLIFKTIWMVLRGKGAE